CRGPPDRSTKGNAMLRQFIKGRVFAADWTRDAPPAADAPYLKVEEVAPLCIASVAGILAGDLLLQVDGSAAPGFDFDGLVTPQTTHAYRFFRPSTKQWLNLRATGAPLGIKTGETTEGILKRIRAGDEEWDDLDELWKRGEWKGLEEAGRIM